MNIQLDLKSINDLQKELEKIKKNLKEYEGEHTIELSYSKEQWDSMTEYEKEKAIEEQEQKYIHEKLKGGFKK